MRYALPVTALALAALAGPAQSGEITRADTSSPFKWETTQCVRPATPFIRTGDPNRQQIMLKYAAQVERFIDCMKTEAQRDFDRTQIEMQDAVQRSLQAEVDRMNASMEAVVRSSR